MKWLYRLMTFAILGIALGLPFFIDNKDGKPMLSLPSGDTILNEGKKVLPPTAVYKWRDASNQWHYGDNPPPGARDLQPLQIDTNTNIVQSVKLPEENPGSTASTSSNKPGYTPPQSNKELLTVERALNLMNDARAVRDQMEARNSQLNQIVGESNR